MHPIATMLGTLITGCLGSLPGQHTDDLRPRRIDASIELPQGAVLRRALVITADGITIDGRGAVLIGPARPGQPKTGRGIGLLAEGRRDITLKNFSIRGFRSGLVIRGGGGWHIENCDFSDNYHDLDYGWGDGERVGGMILTDVVGARIRNCRAQRNWNGLDLFSCRAIEVDHCDLSHCSNVCLKLWRSCANIVRHCNLSYGLRIRPGEVHARDSTSVLFECGSNDNRLEYNDITHGGDGVFIRVLNGWISTGNVFRGNDCSYANNNGFESWSPGNTYLDNKANHCSYGFWLGGSDRTVLIGNEASHNGLPGGFHNAPESDFGHGGIVIVHGTGTHTLIDSNTCIGNRGGGIVFRGDLGSRGGKWRMRHLVIQRNRLEQNRYGIFGRFTDGLDLSSNRFLDNETDTEFEDVTDLHRHLGAGAGDHRPELELHGPSRVLVGQAVEYTATAKSPGGAALQWRWRLDGEISTGTKLHRSFATAGRHSLSLTVHDGKLAALAYREILVVDPDEHPATGAAIANWTTQPGGPGGRVVATADAEALIGTTALRLQAAPYSGGAFIARFTTATPADLSNTDNLSFWLRTQNHNNGGFQRPNPIVRLHCGELAWQYTPSQANGMPRDLFGEVSTNPSRNGWMRVEIPLRGAPHWHRERHHAGPTPPFVAGRLSFATIDCGLSTERDTGLVSNGETLFCAERGRIHRSNDGRRFTALPTPPRALAAVHQGTNGMLTLASELGEAGSLILTVKASSKRPAAGHGGQLLIFDIGTASWRRHPTVTAMSHGATMVGDQLFGLAHAIGANFGGPLCRIDFSQTGQSLDDHSVLDGVGGADAWWFSRAAQLAELQGLVYAIKNDWHTPQPKADTIGDRLLVFDPRAYAASEFQGDQRWDDKNWRARHTSARDLGALPFEIGHGASLVALPAGWGNKLIGTDGGLFILAGCSPANHEGHGRPSRHWAIYDIAAKTFQRGALPAPTGAGSSACLFQGKLMIKRGGVHDQRGNQQLWIVTPIDAAAARQALTEQAQRQPDLRRVGGVSLQFDSVGHQPVTIWVDGLRLDGFGSGR